MDNLFFDDNISVSISQNPSVPSEGDDIVFTATAKIDNITIESYQYDNPTYFFSYTWLVSEDNGITYKKIGEDIETLTVKRVSKEAINYIYKVKVAVIDLNNILLTEDGDNLTTQYGEILLNNPSTSGNNSQTIINDTPKINISQDATLKDIVNVQSIIDEHKTYDPLIDDTAAAKIYSLYPSIDEIVAGKKTQGDLDVIVPVESIPDPDIEIPTEPQGVRIQTENTCKKEQVVGTCGTTVSWCKNLPPCDRNIKCVGGNGQIAGEFPNYKKNNDKYCCNSITKKCSFQKIKCNVNNEGKGIYETTNCKTFEIFRENRTDFADVLDKDCGCKGNRSKVQFTIRENAEQGIFAVAAVLTTNGLIELVLSGVATLGGIIAVAAGGFLLAAGYGIGLWYKLSADGTNNIYYETSACSDSYSGDSWECMRCGKSQIITSDPDVVNIEGDTKVFPGKQLESIESPNFDCRCYNKSGEFVDGGKLSIGLSDNNCEGCKYVITQKCGPPGGYCSCTSNDSTKKQVKFDIPDDLTENGMIGVNSGEFFDCIFADQTFCGARCDGSLCCGNNNKKVVYTIKSSSDNVKCNASKLLNNIAGVPKDQVKISACDPNSTNDRNIVIISIIPKMSENGKGLTLEEAKEKAMSLIGSKYGVIVIFKMVKNEEKKEVCNIDGNKVYEYYKTAYDSHKIVENCKKCKPIYKVTCGDGSYACDDSNVPCKIPNQGCKGQEGSTKIKIATVSKNDDPSDDDIDKADKVGGNTYTTLEAAKSEARRCVGEGPGVICSG